jgi:hypothetical protein
MQRVRMIGGKVVAHVTFEAADAEGHRREVEQFMAWLKPLADGSARAIFEGLDKVAISEHMDYYREKAKEARPKCAAFAFVGLGGMKAVMFNFILVAAHMPMRMTATVAEAEAWVAR